MDREWETLEHSGLDGLSLSNPASQGSGFYVEEEAERLLRVRGTEWLQGHSIFQTQQV